MKKTTPIKAIRAKCLDCSIFQPKEVRFCSAEECSLYPFRLGKNPNRKKKCIHNTFNNSKLEKKKI